MFEQFYMSMQQDVKLFLVFPILCAVFRSVFIAVYNPYPTLADRKKSLWTCFRYGFWWGMDFNAYMFLIPLILVSLPAAFLSFFSEYGDVLRVAIGLAYAVILYAAFMGKMIFYRHFHDTYNYLIHMGKHAEKHNLVDIFFNQDHGLAILLGYIPYIAVITAACWGIQQLPSIPYPVFESSVARYGFNLCVFLGSILGFYWFRFGGTLNHRNKPEWDTIPSIVKEEAFLARACIDDLVALKWVRRRPVAEELQRSEEELKRALSHILPGEYRNGTWESLPNPAHAFKRIAKGARIRKPQHIFFIVGESVPQWAMDPMYSGLHVLDGSRALKDDEHTAYLNNFLPAGNISRPSIVSLMTGIYDAQLELNEMEAFWHGTLPTTFAGQMKKLGYQTIYWYGGNASNGNFNHFGKAQGFDRIESATTFCGEDAPRTWVGVYDHVFLEKAAELIKEIDVPTFHFVYTTSNHGPYKIPKEVLQFDSERLLSGVGEDIRNNKERCAALGTAYYADQAVSRFIRGMRDSFPDSLFIYTGDHSSLYATLGNSSLVPRDYSFRELFCTPLFIHHRQISKNLFGGNTIGTHLNIIPTVIELVAPKGFEYYSLYPSLTEQQPEGLVTPKQWITPQELGEIASKKAEVIGESTPQIKEKYDVKDEQFIQLSSDFISLTAWIVKHKNECLDSIS
ncbi:LTA synthase family protein [Megasphaera stantonii]|uniref:LTA synthase family protein n=1 Tax=Megasphaera stantonii TaxID=2144175 RepID=UPI0029420D34|nr:LTA synthase family protein [Megasphaera stantonii]